MKYLNLYVLIHSMNEDLLQKQLPIVYAQILLKEEFPCYARWIDKGINLVWFSKSRKAVPLEYLNIGNEKDSSILKPHLKH